MTPSNESDSRDAAHWRFRSSPIDPRTPVVTATQLPIFAQSGVVATIDAYDTSALGYLPLEEMGLDVPIELTGYYINDVASTLLIDEDRDGFYSRFRVTFDPDTDYGGSYVYVAEPPARAAPAT